MYEQVNIGSAPSRGPNKILQLSSPIPYISLFGYPLKLSTSWTIDIDAIYWQVAITLKTYREQANCQNFHVCNSHRQHAGRLFETVQYDRLSQQQLGL